MTQSVGDPVSGKYDILERVLFTLIQVSIFSFVHAILYQQVNPEFDKLIAGDLVIF